MRISDWSSDVCASDLPRGPLAEHNIRTTFASNLLASGGIDTVNPGTVDAAAVAAAVDGHRAVVICGTDARSGSEADAVVSAARDAGVTHIYLAENGRAHCMARGCQ